MKISAGILLFRRLADQIEYFLVHPGGPFFAKKDLGVWSVPKGELDPGEDPLTAAIREFQEETGHALSGDFYALKPIVQKGGKQVVCWAIEGDLDVETVVSNTFALEWPPRSGKMTTIPEVDRGGWFTLQEAKKKINERQVPLLEEVEAKYGK